MMLPWWPLETPYIAKMRMESETNNYEKYHQTNVRESPVKA
jgi:hypothetical protein